MSIFAIKGTRDVFAKNKALRSFNTPFKWQPFLPVGGRGADRTPETCNLSDYGSLQLSGWNVPVVAEWTGTVCRSVFQYGDGGIFTIWDGIFADYLDGLCSLIPIYTTYAPAPGQMLLAIGNGFYFILDVRKEVYPDPAAANGTGIKHHFDTDLNQWVWRVRIGYMNYNDPNSVIFIDYYNFGYSPVGTYYLFDPDNELNNENCVGDAPPYSLIITEV